MRKNFKKLLLSIIFVIFILLIMSIKTEASSLNVTTSKSTVSPGETFKVTVKVSGGAGIVNISVKNGTGSTSQFIDNSSYSFNCKAGSSGSVSISVNATIADYTTEKDQSKSASKTVSIKAKSTNNKNTSTKKSSDATLSTLGVLPKEYDFSNFSKNKTSYSVTVPNDVEKLTVQYKTSNSKATVKVSGNTNLVVGSANKISVVVTAEDGTKKTYTIAVTKLAKDEEKEGNVIDDKNKDENNNDEGEDGGSNVWLERLEVKNFTLSPEFSSDVYSYKIDVNMNENDIDKLELEYAANSDDAKVEVIGNEDFTEGENIITIMVSGKKDDDKAIYQIIVNKTRSDTKEVSGIIENGGNNIINKGKNIVITIVVVLVVLIIVTIILIKIVEKRLNGDSKSEKEDFNEEVKDTENKTYYENKENDADILNKINKNKGKHF